MLEKDGLGVIAVDREALALHRNLMLKRLLWIHHGSCLGSRTV